ncbi:hypothetical protein DMN91_001672 [Ooceraea biroi]|uniref:Monocarboxylate transporter n=1 Tax=Ooceraea biroi TaxID=2015173 RepID=A0A3L8DYU1_OOCBI|nr:hypothetical protein DMN91_001672 [Ooceraea biroi]
MLSWFSGGGSGPDDTREQKGTEGIRGKSLSLVGARHQSAIPRETLRSRNPPALLQQRSPSTAYCREEETPKKNARCHPDDRGRGQHGGDDSCETAVARNVDVRDRDRHVYQRQRHRHVATRRTFLSPVMSISRARSWPLLDTTGMGSRAAFDGSSLKEKNRATETGDSADKNNAAAVQPDGSPQVQARRLLCRHYYPEGGWGWVIAVVGTLVHLLGPGLQFSVPAAIALPAKVKFYHHPLHTADPKVGEYQVVAAAGLSRSASETDEVVKSWIDHDHRVNYPEELLDQPRRRDRLTKYSDSDNNINHYTQNDREWSQQEEKLFSEREIHIVDNPNINVNHDTMDSKICNNVISDRKITVCRKDNENRSEREDTCESALSNQDKIGEYKKVLKRNYTSETVLDNEYCDERETRAARAIKVPIAPANNRIKNPSKSAYASQGVDKAIGGSDKRGEGDIENRKDDCDEDEAESMEISSPRSRAYPRGNDVVVCATTPGTDAHREALRSEASRKIVRTPGKDTYARSPGKTRRSASTRRIAIADQADSSRTPETDRQDTVVQCVVERKGCANATRRCENCGEPHFPYGRHSHPWKYSGCLNRDVADQEATRDAETGIAADQGTDLGKPAAPIAATAVLYRSRSLPRLSVHDSGVACSDHAPAAPAEQTHAASRQLVADLRQLLTLKQHYYPEGGWGWVVLLVGLLVQILSHGAHGSVGVFLEQVTVKFGPHVRLQAG